MLRRRSVVLSGMGTGFAALLAALPILSDRAADIDHRYGWGLLAFALVAIAFFGGVLLCQLVGSDGDENNGGATSYGAQSGAGAVATTAGHDNTTTINIYGTDDPPPRPPESRARLVFRMPEVTTTPIYMRDVRAGTVQQTHTVDLWRISVSNETPDTKAEDVSVRFEKAAPPLRYGPLPLHKTGDDQPPYHQTFDLTHGRTELLDVVARSRETGDIFLWRSDDISYAMPLEPREAALWNRAMRDGRGVRITLRATSIDAEAIEHAYLLTLSDAGELLMRPE